MPGTAPALPTGFAPIATMTTLFDLGEALLNGTLDGNMVAEFLSFMVALTIAITVHEFAHAKRAQMAGDPTAEMNGRVTLNPLAHYDPIGTTLILLGGFGWGRPVPVNPALFRRPRRDDLMVSLWGPLSNFITATVFALPLKFRFAGDYSIVFEAIVLVNLMLGLFNLLPVFPLDGSHILSALLPVEQARRLDLFYHRYGTLLLIALILTRVTSVIVGVPMALAYWLLTGPFPFGLLARGGCEPPGSPRAREHEADE
jgi:Zn-dependent protease